MNFNLKIIISNNINCKVIKYLKINSSVSINIPPIIDNTIKPISCDHLDPDSTPDCMDLDSLAASI